MTIKEMIKLGRKMLKNGKLTYLDQTCDKLCINLICDYDLDDASCDRYYKNEDYILEKVFG